MKKIIKKLLYICMCSAVPLFFAGCKSTPGCIGSGEWQYDTATHWQMCKDPTCPKKVDYGRHTMQNGTCTICGYGEIAGARYTFLGNGEYELSEIPFYENTDKNIVINGVYNDGYHGEGQVTIIGELAFADNQNLQSITIPDTIKTIKARAFSGCSSLSLINWGKNISTICESAFSGTGLQSVAIPESVVVIENKVFSDCQSLKSASLPSNMSKISDWLFYNCPSLTTITVPSTIKTIGEFAFYNCFELTSFPFLSLSDLQTISEGSFFNCYKLENVKFLGSVKTIGKKAFSGCRNITSIEIPDGVHELEEGVFDGCQTLKTATFGNTLKVIGKNAFSGVIEKVYYEGSIEEWTQISGLQGLLYKNGENGAVELYVGFGKVKVTELDLSPLKIEEIKPYAFYRVNGISKIALPDTLKKIGEEAFNGSSYSSNNKLDLSYAGDANSWVGIDGLSNLMSYFDSISLFVESNISIDGANITATAIKDFAFANCKNLENITLSDYISSVGDMAFSGCTNLNCKTVNGAKYIGNANKNLVLLKVVDSKNEGEYTIDATCKFIMKDAFSNSNITKLKIPSSVIYIATRAFSGCEKLQQVIIYGNSSLKISNRAFYGDKNIKKLVIENAGTIESNAFEKCTGLEEYFVLNTDNWNDYVDNQDKILKSLAVYQYSSEKPSTSGKFWHYNESGTPTKWY